MNSLPLLVVEHICSYLPSEDLKSLRLACRNFDATGARHLFSELHLSGCEQQLWYERKGDGRTRFAEYGHLDEAVSEVLPVAAYVKELRFTPAFYFKGLWDRIQRERDKALHKANFQGPGCDLDEETWEKMMAEQTDQSEAAIIESLATLFKEMRLLRRIEIAGPTFARRLFAGMDFSWVLRNCGFESSKVDMFSRVTTQAMLQANRHIKELHMHGLAWRTLKNTPGLQHVMYGLEVLELDVQDYKPFFENKPIVAAARDLLKTAAPTLRVLSLTSDRSGVLVERGVHSLTKVLFEDDETTPLVFPRLESFRLGNIITSPKPLRDFIAAQPSLVTLDTEHVHLGLLGVDWLDVAAALPPTVVRWVIASVGHGPATGFEPPIAYNWVHGWKPENDAKFSALGWRSVPPPNEARRYCGLYERKR